jgi:hypothetical protein
VERELDDPITGLAAKAMILRFFVCRKYSAKTRNLVYKIGHVFIGVAPNAEDAPDRA